MAVSTLLKPFDVIVLGGGAAGLMCAIAAGQRGRSVLVLEGANRIGKKILMSGGGRCNFTNLNCQSHNFLSANPDFCVSALRRYTQTDFIELVEKHGIPYHEKSAGQLFCDRRSRDIVDMLATECDRAGVSVLTSVDIKSVRQGNGYIVATANSEFEAPALVVATGGLSIPKMGASDLGYRIARQFELPVLDTRAALVPFTFSGALHELTGRLSGVSLPAALAAGNRAFTESILFTHRGLSGPAALQISSYWTPGESLSVDLLPAVDAAALLLAAKSSQPRALLRTALTAILPRALVLELQALFFSKHAEHRLAEIPDREIRQLGARLNDWSIKPGGTEGYRTAEVTLGGVDTRALSSRTMECKTHPGLYFIGEVVDVTGHLGGFNFQWAWSSGQAAGRAA